MMKKILYLIVISLLNYSCINLDGENKIELAGYFGGEATPAPSIELTELTVTGDQLVIEGRELDNIDAIRIVDDLTSTSYSFNIDSKSSTRIAASALAAVDFTVDKAYTLFMSDAQAATSYPITFTIPADAIVASNLSDMGASDGDVLRYNLSSDTWEPTSLNGLNYKGLWDASSGVTPDSSPEAGDYWVVSVSGTTWLIGGISSWTQEDWAIYNGSEWQKVSNTSTITSIFGRTGAITAQYDDYSWDLINKDSSSIGDINDVDTDGVENDQVLKWDSVDQKWKAADDDSGAGSGSYISSIKVETPLAITTGTDPTISLGGTVPIASGGTGATTSDGIKANIGLSNVEDTKISTWTGSANINTVGTISNGVWNGTAVAITYGGTGANNATDAVTNLGAQPQDTDLDDLADGTLTSSKIEHYDYFILDAGNSGQVWTSDGSGRGYWATPDGWAGGNSLNAADNDPLYAVYVDSLGYVGIGTTTPSEKLHIYNSAGSNLGIVLQNLDTGVTASDGFTMGIDSSENTYIHQRENADMFFLTNETYQMTIKNSGYVGIGTTAPYGKLHVIQSGINTALQSAAVDDTIDLQFYDADDASGSYKWAFSYRGNSAGDDLALYKNGGGTTLMFWDYTNDYVGIGTSSPEQKLDLVGRLKLQTTKASGQKYGIIQMAHKDVGEEDTALIYADTTSGTDPELYIGGNIDDLNAFTKIAFYTATSGTTLDGIERMVIDKSGNVGIGTTNPGYQLEITGTAGMPGGGSWTDSSDIRLKKNINKINSKAALEKIQKLQGYFFEWINPEEHDEGVHAGLLAQDLMEVFPKWITEKGPEGLDAELIPEGPSYGVRFPHAYNAYMIEAVKELANRIKKLEDENRNLKERIKKIETSQ